VRAEDVRRWVAGRQAAEAREELTRSTGNARVTGEPAEALGRVALRLARQAVERQIWLGRLLELAGSADALPPPLAEPGAAFVTLRLDGRLRGCIGTFAPSRPTLAHEIIAVAILAATRDPRFPPVVPAELPRLRYEVSIVGALEPAASLEDLDPAAYGVVVEGERGRAGLLPGLDTIDTPDRQVAVARAKAGLEADAPVRLYRFRTRHFVERPAPGDGPERA
jgi:AmmeMemoRadiSam system protein A